MKVGDKFEVDYPFKIISYESHGLDCWEGIKDQWMIGCETHVEQYGEGYGETFHSAHGVGKLVFEILAIVEMPRTYKNRIIYKFDRVYPDGRLEKSSKCHMVTEKKFNSMLKDPYGKEWNIVEPDKPSHIKVYRHDVNQ